jgi:ferric-dicitrate binding protein FerR (iron transport regulator)
MRTSPDGRNSLLAQAALWEAILRKEDTPEHRVAFANWLLTSPQHVEAYLTLACGLCEAEQLATTDRTTSREDSSALQRAKATPAQAAVATPNVPRSHRPLLLLIRTLCAALVLWLVLPKYATLVHPDTTSPPLLATNLPATDKTIPSNSEPKIPDQIIDSIGFYTLRDGSLMRVGDHSRVRVHADGGSGVLVALLEGAAYFSGHHDPGGSFRVASGRIGIEVLGTELEVESHNGLTDISVFEGYVRLSECQPSQETSPSPAPMTLDARGSPTLLRADHRVRLPSDACNPTVKLTAASHLDLLRRTSSSEEWLSFNNTPVAVAAEMFNRVNTHCLIVVDKAVGRWKIGGRFLSTDLEGFVRCLSLLGVRVVREPDSPNGTIIHLLPQQ